MLGIARPLYTTTIGARPISRRPCCNLLLIIQGINAHATQTPVNIYVHTALSVKPALNRTCTSVRRLRSSGSCMPQYRTLLRLALLRLVLSVLGLPLLEVGFWAESTLWIVLEAALGCADLGGNEWGELVYVSSCSQLHCSRLLFQTPLSPPSLRPQESD